MSLYGADAQRVVMAAKIHDSVTGIKGTAYVLGRPAIDIVTNQFRIVDLALSIETANWLGKAVVWLKHDDWLKHLAAHSSVDVGPRIEQLKAQLTGSG